MKFFAIRHCGGGYLAVKRAGRNAGYTFEEPTTKGIPRLFTRKQDAQAALDCWLKGWWCSGPDQDGERYIKIKPIPERKRVDMFIVEIRLNVRTT